MNITDSLKGAYGYLLVTKNSFKKIEVIARDYWISTTIMRDVNRQYHTHYSCFVVCYRCSLWKRLKLSWKTGIPWRKISHVKHLKHAEKWNFISLVATDSMVDDTFLGKIKVFDTIDNVPRSRISGQLDVCKDIFYEH